MTRDELKVRVNNRVMSHLLHGAMIPGVEDAIIDIIAPELEKARKYDKEYAERPWVIDHDRWWKEIKMAWDGVKEATDAR